MSEQRVVLLTALSFGAYALLLFMEHHVFIFPFPLNELLFLIVSLYFFQRNHSTLRTVGMVSTLAGLFALLANQFFWSFFLDGAAIERLFNSGWTDLFRLLFYICLLIWAWTTAYSDNGPSRIVLFGVVFFLIMSSLYFQTGLFPLASYAVICGLFFWRNLHPPYTWLWLLLTLLEGGKATMLL